VWGNIITEAPLVDADGNPTDPLDSLPDEVLGAPAPRSSPRDDGPDQRWLDEVLDRNQPGPRPPPPPPGARSFPPSATSDPLQPRPDPSQR
jgi:hypothetical protein